MARFEKDFVAAAEAGLEASELIRALRPDRFDETSARCRAMAHLLSGTDGWEGAAKALGGAFAAEKSGTWLTQGKDK